MKIGVFATFMSPNATPAMIRDFGKRAEGLGLDSIDALELGVAIRKKYGIKIESVNDETKAHFANVRSLATFIASQRQR